MKDVFIALAGNPNSGKTTLFNAMTGAHHRVGNYPGVTVEKREGTRKRGDVNYRFVDLPGVYSLTAYSEDEVVSRNFLLNEKPDLIIDVLDSTNLERNLYLCLQMQELGIPVVGALNMSDESDKLGIRIDEKNLGLILGIPFVKITAQHNKGIDDLLDIVDNTIKNNASELTELKKLDYGTEIEDKLSTIENLIKMNKDVPNSRWVAVKLIEKDKYAQHFLDNMSNGDDIKKYCDSAIIWIEKHFGNDAEIIVSEQRYGYIHGAVAESVKVTPLTDFSLTKTLDKIFMNRVLALPIFIGVLWLIFNLTFTVGAYPQEWLETFFSFLTDVCNNFMPDGLLRSLVVDGIIAGVGGVFSFIPLVVILFLLLSILEDLGYLSRAAFATDKLLHVFGLHGQSIFPIMLGFGCSVPAVMASRTLKSKRDRIITVLVTPMMSCSAKLPIHIMLASAFFPHNAPNMVMLIYVCGAVLALASSAILRRTVLKGDPTPFVLELPPYRMPTLRGILWHVFEKTFSYVKKAGTIIMASAVLVWAITTFPVYEMDENEKQIIANEYLQSNEEDVDAYIETVEAEAQLSHSIAGRIGKAIEPVFKPLGFNWQMSIASITGFAAKEVVVSTLGILYQVGTEEDEDSEGLRGALASDSDLSPLAGFAFMLFMLLLPPCFAALATIKAELGWKWLGFEFVFLTVLGWLVAFAVYQIGMVLV